MQNIRREGAPKGITCHAWRTDDCCLSAEVGCSRFGRLGGSFPMAPWWVDPCSLSIEAIRSHLRLSFLCCRLGCARCQELGQHVLRWIRESPEQASRIEFRRETCKFPMRSPSGGCPDPGIYPYTDAVHRVSGSPVFAMWLVASLWSHLPIPWIQCEEVTTLSGDGRGLHLKSFAHVRNSSS